MTEEWRSVVGYEGRYMVSSEGRIYSEVRWDALRRPVGGNMLKPSGIGKYLIIHLFNRNGSTTKRIHELVAAAFIGPRPDGLEVRHLDGNPRNNRLENLCYGTKVENAQDSLRHGTNRNARKTHCKRGHEFDEANTIVLPSGRRNCLICRTELFAEWHRRNRKGKPRKVASQSR